MKKLVVMTLLLVLTVAVFAQDPEPKVKLDLIDLVKNLDWINLGLVVLFTLGATAPILLKARVKLKQVGELFLMAYEFTDDKVVDKEERKKMIDQFLLIVGKGNAETMQKSVNKKPRPKYRHK